MSDAPPPGEAASRSPSLSPPPASTAAKVKRPAARMPVAACLGILLVLVLALVGAAPYWAPAVMPLLPWTVPVAPQHPAQSPETAQQLALIEQQLGDVAALGNRVAALENKPAPDASAAIAPLAAQVEQLEAHITQIDKQVAQMAHDRASDAESPQRVLMLALASLGNAVAGSRPFAAELASVEALGQSRNGWAAALQPLEAPAKTGIPSTALLAQRFTSDVAPAILRAEAAAPTGKQSLGEAMLTRLKRLVVIRRVDGSGTGTSPTDQAVAHAQAALDGGDLAGAAKALSGLSGAPADAAKDWLAAAQQRLAAEETIAKLSRDLAGDLAAGASGG
ncbi:MAG TPA: mitofilin family membrane protein [Stellaceae bacterium]|nr:mitofilin family membrane protein [Stellaceae bacterium]